jgi:predicted AAA+ superfamily ATPase
VKTYYSVGVDRRALRSLKAWKNDRARKPLVLRGARQVGKTWLLQEFGRSHYEQVAYVDCQRDRSVASIFAGDLDPGRILRGLAIAAGTTINPATTLVIVDEIQEAPQALTSLKYFAEERPDIHLAVAGSLLGVALRTNASFPVGKVNFIELHPLDFDEFLRGTGEAQLADLVLQQDWPLIASYADRLIELLRLYMFVGGMPEAVARHAAGESYDIVRSVQLDILRGYENDFAKYATATVSRRIADIWASLPSQLARENKRFILGRVREGARAREFEEALQWLCDAGLVHQVTRYTKPANPIRAYEDAKIFKLFLHDVGLLGALSGLEASVLLQGSGIFEEFKGALAEQYVLQQIVAARNSVPMYWAPENGKAELDFAIERSGALVPIEVKAEENLQSKSLRSYIDRFQPAEAWRFSLADYREQEDMTNVPLYAIGPRLYLDRSSVRQQSESNGA